LKITFQLSEIQKVAQQLIKAVPNKTLCFYGQMGAGKTTLIKTLLKELGAKDAGSSPTFGLVNEYSDVHGKLLAYHFDFYRLNDESEALDMGLEDYLSSSAWLFMEWPEKISSLLPEDAVPIFLHFVDENTRSIELNVC
jgi:tRNA threonylcarbamoyladenosine biosynthesis protein TsaE